MEIRNISEKDSAYLEQIIELEKEVFGENGAIDYWNLKPIVKYGKVYAVVEKNEILACAELMKSWDSNEVYLYGLAVKKAHFGKGLGRLLLNEILGILLKEGIKKIKLTVAEENFIAKKLYENCGFKKINVLENEYGLGIHRILYEKLLLETEENYNET